MGRLLVGVWLLAAHAIGSGASPLMSPERMAVHGTEGNATNGTHMVITGAPTAKLASGMLDFLLYLSEQSGMAAIGFCRELSFQS